jgi:hypothetical protein
MVLGVRTPVPVKATIPAPLALAKDKGKPDKDTVGLPDWPSPFDIAIPEPLTAMFLGVTVPKAVFTAKPLPAVFKEAAAPVMLIAKAACAPPSVIAKPVLTDNDRLLVRVGSWFTVINVCVCAGDAAIAPVVVFTVTPFCTTGTISVPVIAPAAGN